MIVFELTMPHAASWNGKWTGADRRYIRIRYDSIVPKSIWNKDFYYSWDDGWEACVSVRKKKAAEARKLAHNSSGFCGYDWMITSLIEDGYIHTATEK